MSRLFSSFQNTTKLVKFPRRMKLRPFPYENINFPSSNINRHIGVTSFFYRSFQKISSENKEEKNEIMKEIDDEIMKEADGEEKENSTSGMDKGIRYIIKNPYFPILISGATSFAGIGLLNSIHLIDGTSLTLMVGSMGASAVLLFAAPQVPFSQPRNCIGGHCISAFVGVTCGKLLAVPLAAPMAVSVSN